MNTKQLQQMRDFKFKLKQDHQNTIHICEEERANKKVSDALSYLQKLGSRLKQAQMKEDNKNLEETSYNKQKLLIDTQQLQFNKSDLIDISRSQQNQINDICSGTVTHKSQRSLNQVENRKKYMRKISSFEKQLNVSFQKRTCKVQTVEQLLSQNYLNQWAFDYKSQNFSTCDTEKYQKSLIQYQKEGLRNIAKNLNELTQQLENQNISSYHQKSSTKLNFPTSMSRPLQLKVQQCELKNETLSDRNFTNIPINCDLSSNQTQIKYNSNRNYRKFTYNDQQDIDQNSSCCFSDVISSVSNRGIKKVHISENSIKGIYKNLRKLTEDIMQSDDSYSFDQYHGDSSSISAEKISPSHSIEKRYRLEQVNEDLKQNDSISSQSTNGKSPTKKVQFSIQKRLSKNIEINYTSNDSTRPNQMRKNQLKGKVSSSTDINQQVDNIQQHRHLLPSKHKSSVIPVPKNSNQYLQVPNYYPYTCSNQDKNSFQQSSINCYYVSSKEDFSQIGGFDFDSKDDLMNNDLFNNVQVNQENKPNYMNYKRKSTYDDSHKKTPIMQSKANKKQFLDKINNYGFNDSCNYNNNKLQSNYTYNK